MAPRIQQINSKKFFEEVMTLSLYDKRYNPVDKERNMPTIQEAVDAVNFVIDDLNERQPFYTRSHHLVDEYEGKTGLLDIDMTDIKSVYYQRSSYHGYFLESMAVDELFALSEFKQHTVFPKYFAFDPYLRRLLIYPYQKDMRISVFGRVPLCHFSVVKKVAIEPYDIEILPDVFEVPFQPSYREYIKYKAAEIVCIENNAEFSEAKKKRIIQLEQSIMQKRQTDIQPKIKLTVPQRSKIGKISCNRLNDWIG